MITFYDFATTSTRLVTQAISRVEVYGLENFPRTGPVIVAPNHLHTADPPILGGFLPRKVYFMVKQEAWNDLFLGLLSRWFEAFPVRRGEADLAAYRYALRVLDEGKVLGIFPEGHRSPDGRLQPGQPGAIILAQRSGAPILPIGISGVREVLGVPGVFLRRRIRITVGEPYHPPRGGREQIAELTNDLMARIAALLPPEHAHRPVASPTPPWPRAR